MTTSPTDHEAREKALADFEDAMTQSEDGIFMRAEWCDENAGLIRSLLQEPSVGYAPDIAKAVEAAKRGIQSPVGSVKHQALCEALQSLTALGAAP